MHTVRMLDLRAEYELSKEDIRAAIDAVLDSQVFIGGPAIADLERALRERLDVGYAIAVSSGTDALLCSLMALGIGAGDEVIVPALTFFSTAGSVARLGARPVFVDIDPRTYNLDPGAAEAAMTERTKAIIVVHLYGQCAEMDGILKATTQRGVFVIEDAAQALGARYRGRMAGTLSDVACTSFYPTKNLGGFGDGGMMFTNDPAWAEVLRQLRDHGQSERYIHPRVGGNFRLDALQAAILKVKLRHWDGFTDRRRQVAARYDQLLNGAPVTRPFVAPHQYAVYHQYSILCERRDELAEFLRERGIESRVYYPIPLHLQKCFESLGYRRGSLPVTERTCHQILSLPCHPMLTEDDLVYVTSAVCEFYGTTCAGRRVPVGVAGD